MSEITKHEFAHRVTSGNPNKSALGEQAAHESGIGNYLNHLDENGLPIKDIDNQRLYRENTDEISSFFIGEYKNANTAAQIRQWRIENGLQP
jgi:hypothetical protein